MFNLIIFLETTGRYGFIDISFDMSMSSRKDVQYQTMWTIFETPANKQNL